MRIGEFSKKTGISSDTIRFYEKRGFFTGKRLGNGYRDYSAKDVAQAELIALGKSMGFSLQEMLELYKKLNSSDTGQRKVASYLREKSEQISQQIVLLKKAKQLLEKKIKECQTAENSRAKS